MPTFENIGTSSYQVENISGSRVTVASGETVESYEMLHKMFPDNFKKTLDTPYLERVTGFHEISFSTAETKDLELTAAEVQDGKYAKIVAVGSGLTIVIKLNSTSAKVHRKLNISGGFVATKITLKRQVESLHLTSNQSGTVYVYIRKE